MKEVNVNKELCIKCGACVAIASDCFDFDDEGFSEPKIAKIEVNNDIQNAIECCPTSAIFLSDENK